MGSSSWSGSVTVEDLSYDGFKDGSAWTGGLGMLTDGEYGSSNFKVDASTLKGIQVHHESVIQQPLSPFKSAYISSYSTFVMTINF